MKTAEPLLEVWEIDDTDFPVTGTSRDKLQFMLNYAILAPSSHNTQPWLFKITGDAVELYADRTRLLPVVDPEGRELVMSCGAALFALRVAIRFFGYEADVQTFPGPRHTELLARIRLGARREPTELDKALFYAIPLRHTNRLPFEDRPVAAPIIAALVAAAQQEGARLRFVGTDEERTAVADLIWEGDRIQWADKQFRQELVAWIRPNRSDSRDGIPGYAQGFGDLKSSIGPLAMRAFDLGKQLSEKDRKRALVSPALAVLETDNDLPLDWLAAGQAVCHVLLLARAHGVSASFFNQPIEVRELRPQLRAALNETGFPQLLLRFGYGPEVKPTPRRPLEEVARQSPNEDDS
jgi:nitroreductase